MKTSLTKTNSIQKILLGAATSMVIIGCGNNSKDPMKDYSDLADDVPPQPRVVRDQKLDVCQAEVFMDVPTLFVVEGQTTKKDIFVRGLNVNPNEKLVAVNPPAGLAVSANGVMTPREGLKFTISYSPKLGTIDFNKNYMATEAELITKTDSVSEVQCAKLKVGIIVARTNEVPTIQKVNAPEKIELSRDAGGNLVAKSNSTKITVDVQAIGLAKAADLRLADFYDESVNSKENPVFDLTQVSYVVPTVQSLGKNIYRLQYEVNSQYLALYATQVMAQLAKTKPSATDVEMMVQLTAYNHTTGLKSPSQNVVITVSVPKKETPSEKQ